MYELSIESEYGDQVVLFSRVVADGSINLEGRGETLADAFRNLAEEMERQGS